MTAIQTNVPHAEILDFIAANAYICDNMVQFTDRKRARRSDYFGYITYKIKGKYYKEHHIMWYLSTGKWPEYMLDHIDGNPSNNSITNLRIATYELNNKNQHWARNAITGRIGISKSCQKGLLAVYVTQVNGKTYRFRTLAEAIKIRKDNGYKV